MDNIRIVTPDGAIDVTPTPPADSSREAVVSVKHLCFSYGVRKILTDISFDLYEGEIFGFLGPNGSGKTTTIKLMLGLLPIESGRITVCGKNVSEEFEEAMEHVGGIVENPEMYPYLTGRQNLELFRRMLDGVPKSCIDELAELVGLSERIADKVSRYSLGMRQRLGIAQALLCEPRVLVLDEPTNGLDPMGIKELRDLLIKLSHERGVAVFISSHQLAELDMICDRVAVIDSGKILRTLTMDEIRNPVSDGRVELTVDISPESAGNIPVDCPLSLIDGKLVGTVAQDDIPSLISSLAVAGVAITGVNQKQRSLEDAFLALMQSDIRVPKTEAYALPSDALDEKKKGGGA